MFIAKNSTPDRPTRYPLNANEDIVGFTINIPGIKRGNSTIQSLTINIKPKLVDAVDWLWFSDYYIATGINDILSKCCF